MNDNDLRLLLNKPATDIYIRLNNAQLTKRLLSLLYGNSYRFVDGKKYDLRQSAEDLKTEIESDFYKLYSLNDKPILHIYCDTWGENCLETITLSEIKTFPNCKKIKIHNYRG